jgi:hypothetical protein
MSINLSAVAAKIYDSAVKQAYQDSAKLTPTVYTKTAKKSDEIKFRTMGKGLATQVTTPSADVVPMDVDHGLVACPLTNWRAAEYTDIFDNAEVNFSEVNELAGVIAKSLGRRSDQLVLDALATTTTTAVGTTGTALSIDTLIAAKKTLDAAGVPMEDRYFVVESKGISDLLKTTEVTNSDYNSVKALVAGEVDTFLGFKIIQIADRAEGGIETVNVGADYQGYAYHKRSVGFGRNMDISTKAEWVSQKQSWLSVGNFKGGAVKIDDEGIVPVIYGV